MDRIIGNVFEYKDITIEVVEDQINTCYGCYFDFSDEDCFLSEGIIGNCSKDKRLDRKSIIFKISEPFNFLQ